MRCLLLLIAVLFCKTTFSQYQVEFARLGVNEGLSQNSVYAIHQDEQGFLWVGTGDGLNRYDGKEFLTYREKFGDSSSAYLPGRIILSKIFQDTSSRLWFKTNQGLVVFEKKKKQFLKPSRFNSKIKQWETQVELIGIDQRNHVWLKSATDFFSLNPHTWNFQIIKQPGGAQTIRDAVIVDGQVFFLLTDGLYSLSTVTNRIEKRKSFSNAEKVNLLSPQKLGIVFKGRIWTVSLPEWKEEEIVIKTNNFHSPLSFFDVVCEYPQHVFYLRVPGEGLARYNHGSGEMTFFKHEALNSSSLSNNFITTSFIDRSYNLWIGTEGGGLSRLDLKPQKFKSFPSYNLNARQAANLMVKSIFKLSGKILVGTFSQGLYVVNTSNSHFQQYKLPELFKKETPPSINVFYRDSRGRLWMNARHMIGVLDTNSFRFTEATPLKPAKGETEFSCWIYSMLEYKPDHFLLGTLAGLHRMKIIDGKIETYRVPSDSIIKGHIQALQKAPDGSTYVGKIGNGFWQIRPTENGIEVLDKGFLTTGIRHFYFDKKRPIVWMASESGLIAYNSRNKSYTVYDERAGMSNSYVYSILPENDTTFWVSTNKGLNKVETRYSGNDVVASIRFSAYTQIDGLQSNEFNTGAFFKSGDGEFFFGGVNGINWFKPNQIVANHFKPSVVLTNLRVNEKEVFTDGAIHYLNCVELPYDQNTISFRFASLEFTNAGANEYAYQLQGLDKDWIYSQTSNEARYANLSPGNYIFKVRGSNSDGVWSDQPLTFSIQIHPPFWMTTTFRVVAVIVILAIIGFSIRFYISMLVRNRLKDLEKQRAVNEERLRISKDMHDELGTGLTKIALLSEVSRRAHLQAKAEMPLQEIANTSRQLTQKMGEIIWTLNPGNDTLDNLAAYLKEQLYDLSEAADLPVDFDFPQKVPAITMTNLERQQILLVTKEAFNNVVKHAQATRVCFSLQVGSNDITFMLRDNGSGFEVADAKPSVNGKRNGLANMRWRIEQVGGKFEIKSTTGEGTSLCFSLPQHK